MRPLYFIKKAAAGMRNAPLISLLAVLNMALSLTMIGGFLVGFINAKHLAERLESRLEVVAYLKEGISPESLKGMEDKIKGFPEVRKVVYISKEDALDSLKKGLAEDSSILDGIEENPLPASFVIKLNDGFQDSAGIKSVTARLRGIESVDELQYGGQWLERFSAVISIIKFGGAAFGVILVLSSMLIVSNTIRLTVQTRMEEIELMRLVGATPLFIRLPFFIEGAILGILGAILACGAMAAAKGFIEYNLGNELKLLFGRDIDILPYQAIIGLFSFGIVFGLFGSVLSLRRFPKA